MKLIAWTLMLLVCLQGHSQEISEESSQEIVDASKTTLFEKASEAYSQGKYRRTILELTAVEEVLKTQSSSDKAIRGLIAYWKGVTYNRLQDFPEAIVNFDQALGYGYEPQDLRYEYGQALFASERLADARIQFRESLRRNFKRAVSLYYIAYISKEMGERKKAFTFFRAIDKLPAEEAQEVKQAAEMQIGDIYLEQSEKHPDSFRTVENYVIPQYQRALELDQNSSLANVIREKILSLQRKYDLILLQLRNGRPTLNPPYFLRLAQEVGLDSNVTFSPTETTIDKSRQESTYSRTSAIGRYTFYVQDWLSISPEVSAGYTRYFNRVEEIYRNDNFVMGAALRNSYEHELWQRPASVLLDYDYSEVKRDVDAEKKLKFNSRAHSFMIGERFNYFDRGETVVRLRHRIFDSYLSESDSSTTSLMFEQVWALKVNTLLFFASYDRTRVKEELFDTDALTIRADLIMARVRDWFTPSIGLGLTSTDPINDRSNRGRELLINPSLRISKTFGKNWRGNLKYEYQKNDSKDEDSFAYTKSLYAFELEYLF